MPLDYCPPETYRTDYYLCESGISSLPQPSIAIFLQSELNNVVVECHNENWDGHGAAPVSAEAYEAAQRFISTLQPGIPQPSISADPDGCITFEWSTSSRNVLLVSVHPDYRLDFAAKFGTSQIYGSAPFFDQLSDSVEDLVRSVFA